MQFKIDLLNYLRTSPFIITGKNLDKCLVQDLFPHPLGNQVGDSVNRSWVKYESAKLDLVNEFVYLLTSGGLISVRFGGSFPWMSKNTRSSFN
jgi:hypothetical protein